MSLLMDALKKAEQEKKAASERLQSSQQPAGQPATSDPQQVQEQDQDKKAPLSAIDTDESLDNSRAGLSLVPTDEETLTTKPADSAGDENIPENTPPDPVADVKKSSTSPSTNLKQDTKAEQLPEIEDYGYFSKTISSFDLAKDIGKGGPTPVSAQTVFIAGSAKSRKQTVLWVVLLILGLLIAALWSLFVVKYTLPSERFTKPLLATRDIEIDLPTEQTDLSSGAELNDMAVDDLMPHNENVQHGIALQTSLETLDVMEDEHVTDDISLAQKSVEDDALQEEVLHEEVREEVLETRQQEIILQPELIKISRKKIDKADLLSAYQQYLTGNYDAAATKYHDVLQKFPENRDALLGLAAISEVRGDIRQAYVYYMEILKSDPEDRIAKAALINFQEQGDLANNENILKTLIQNQPDNPFLHYSLGRFYAKQQQWSEAQQSFFNAYSKNASNADYAYNLAVSLEHIGQSESAVHYYNIALQMADKLSVSFEKVAVAYRIDELSAMIR